MGYQSSPGPHTNNMFSKILLLAASAGFISAARVARDSGYGAPEVSSYGAPEPSYAEPVVEEYSAPAYINLTSVRRSFNDNGPMALAEKVKDVAQAVLEDKNILTKYDQIYVHS